jgi:hypothetical protein
LKLLKPEGTEAPEGTEGIEGTEAPKGIEALESIFGVGKLSEMLFSRQARKPCQEKWKIFPACKYSCKKAARGAYAHHML